MRTRLAASITVLSLASAAWGPPRAAADGEKTYDLSRRDRWQAGDLRTLTGKRVEKRRLKRTADDGTVSGDVTTLKTIAFTLIEQCEEADTEGHATKWRVYVKEWELKSGDAADAVLKGTFLVATAKGMDRAYALEPADRETSTDAHTWLEITFGPKSASPEALMQALAPLKPVAIGETWTPDGAALVDALGSGMPFDKPKVACTANLLAVEDGFARRSFEITLPLTGLLTSSGIVLPWTTGGVSKVTAEGTLALEGRVAASKGSSRQTMSGTATADGGTIEVEIDVTSDLTTEIGGEMPKPPEAPKPPDSPPK